MNVAASEICNSSFAFIAPYIGSRAGNQMYGIMTGVILNTLMVAVILETLRLLTLYRKGSSWETIKANLSSDVMYYIYLLLELAQIFAVFLHMSCYFQYVPYYHQWPAVLGAFATSFYVSVQALVALKVFVALYRRNKQFPFHIVNIALHAYAFLTPTLMLIASILLQYEEKADQIRFHYSILFLSESLIIFSATLATFIYYRTQIAGNRIYTVEIVMIKLVFSSFLGIINFVVNYVHYYIHSVPLYGFCLLNYFQILIMIYVLRTGQSSVWVWLVAGTGKDATATTPTHSGLASVPTLQRSNMSEQKAGCCSRCGRQLRNRGTPSLSVIESDPKNSVDPTIVSTVVLQEDCYDNYDDDVAVNMFDDGSSKNADNDDFHNCHNYATAAINHSNVDLDDGHGNNNNCNSNVNNTISNTIKNTINNNISNNINNNNDDTTTNTTDVVYAIGIADAEKVNNSINDFKIASNGNSISNQVDNTNDNNTNGGLDDINDTKEDNSKY